MVKSSPRTSPFPGLRPFELGEEHLFFGREGQADKLLIRLQSTHFLAVVGTSGSGKSSLVRAGLLPSLYSGLMPKTSSSWRVAIMRPGSAPIANLASALNVPEVFGVATTKDDTMIRTALTESTLRRGALGLVEVTQQARMAPYDHLLLVVDQFEELFRFKAQAQNRKLEAEDEAAAFVKLLLGAVGQREAKIFVVLTMRSDFLGDCAQFRDLPEALNDSQYLIPRLTRQQLKRAIEGPIAVGGGTITPRLVNRLLNDAGDNPDQLPILQHALMRTWDHWRDQDPLERPIDLADYETIGCIDRALSLHADQIYLSFEKPEHRKVIEAIFKRLTEKGTNNREVRRPTQLKELCALTKEREETLTNIINRFRKRDTAFITPPPNHEITAETFIDISQESLMRSWARLEEWMNEEIEMTRTYKRLAETAKLYFEGKAAPIRDPELKIAINWQNKSVTDESNKYGENSTWAERYSDNFKQVNDFIKISESQRKNEEESRDKTNRTGWIGNYLRFISLFLVSLVIFLSLQGMPSLFGLIALAFVGYTIGSIRIIHQGTEALVERLGRYHRKLKPGLNFIVPFLDVIVLIDNVREQLMEIDLCPATTRDQVNVSIDVVIFWRILELELAYYAIENLEAAINEVIVIALRSEVNKLDFGPILSSSDFLDRVLLSYLDEATEPWGIKVTRVEVREIMPSTPTRKVYGHSNLIDIG